MVVDFDLRLGRAASGALRGPGSLEFRGEIPLYPICARVRTLYNYYYIISNVSCTFLHFSSFFFLSGSRRPRDVSDKYPRVPSSHDTKKKKKQYCRGNIVGPRKKLLLQYYYYYLYIIIVVIIVVISSSAGPRRRARALVQVVIGSAGPARPCRQPPVAPVPERIEFRSFSPTALPYAGN